METIYPRESFPRKLRGGIWTKWRNKFRKRKASPVRGKLTMKSSSLSIPAWTTGTRCPPAMPGHPLSFSKQLLQPSRFKPPGVNLQWGYVHVPERNYDNQAWKVPEKEGLDFTCAFAGTSLSSWVYAVIPMGTSPPAKIQAQILRLLLFEIVRGASTESDREVPSLASALPSCLLRLTSLFPFHFGGPI